MQRLCIPTLLYWQPGWTLGNFPPQQHWCLSSSGGKKAVNSSSGQCNYLGSDHVTQINVTQSSGIVSSMTKCISSFFLSFYRKEGNTRLRLYFIGLLLSCHIWKERGSHYALERPSMNSQVIVCLGWLICITHSQSEKR